MSVVVTSTVDYDWIDPVAITKSIMENLAPAALAELKAAWPSSSGRSAEAWDFEINEGNDDDITLRFVNDSGYAGFITIKGTNVLAIDKIGGDVLEALTVRLVDEISEALGNSYRTRGARREISRG